MTTTTSTESARRNGVDTATLFATLDAMKAQHEIAKFQFRASNTWVTGTHSRSTAAAVVLATAPDRVARARGLLTLRELGATGTSLAV
jgi:hypothetical protein